MYNHNRNVTSTSDSLLDPFDVRLCGVNQSCHCNPSVTVIVGSIKYPGEGGPPGKLIFAQAALTNALPYQVLEYSQNDAGFPRDSTADQWFNSQQFDAYQQLGRYLGEQAVEILAKCSGSGPVNGGS